MGNRTLRRYCRLPLVLLLACGGGCGTGSAPQRSALVGSTRIALDDPNLYLSPYNWSVKRPASATTTQPGAYLSVGFRSTNVRLEIDTSTLTSLPKSATPVLRWQIDNGPLRSYQVAAGDMEIPLNPAPLSEGKHVCRVWFVASDYRQDRWVGPAEALRITGLTLDAGGTTLAPSLAKKRILFFGDSITEGVRTEGAATIPTQDDDATHAFPYTCAAALGAEFGVVGVARQGWTIAGNDGSNVPPFTTSWPTDFAGNPRVFSPAPDYVVVMQGSNDANSRADPLQVEAAIANWIAAARAALPTSRLCLVVPFSGFERDALTQAVQTYRASHPAEKSLFLIDLGPDIAGGTPAHPGLQDLSGTPSPYAHDGFHPNAATSESLGAQIAAVIQAVAP